MTTRRASHARGAWSAADGKQKAESAEDAAEQARRALQTSMDTRQ